MVTELGDRGHGEIESGAFLLADRAGDQAHRDPGRLPRRPRPELPDRRHPLRRPRLQQAVGHLRRREATVVIGDVHTHPGRGVHQSGIDAGNPMIAQEGHVALIVPDFAKHPIGAERGRRPPLRRPQLADLDRP